MEFEEIKAIVAQIHFKDWIFRVDTSNGVPYVQVLFNDTDRITGKTELQRCRKWQLSYFMVPSEVVRTVFKAIKAAVAHEVDEEFQYRGVRIFNPHFDLDSLADAVKNHHVGISIRDETNYAPTHK